MNVYADIRCLQDARFAFRGVGIHASTLLAAAKEYLPKGTNLIGLVSPEIGRLDSSFVSIFDSIESVFAPRMPSEPAAFLQMSPMTHDPTRAARLIGRSSIFSASVIYDFIPYDMPERYLADAKNAQDYKLQLAWLPSYDCFFPISQYSARRLKNICSISDDRITTTGVALRPDFESTLHGTDAMLRTVLRPNFPNRYVVCVAGADRRKNVEVLLDAHAKLPTEHNNTHIVIVGSYGESHIAKLIDHYKSQGGLSRKLHFLHGVSDAELTSIYAGAVAAVCCSEIEGFSIPVIEAIACHCPSLVSDNEAHRELVDFEDAFFDIHDSNRLSQLLAGISSQPLMREKMIAAQSPIAQQFTAKRVCERFWKPISRGLREVSGRVRNVSRHNLLNRPRIAILSPYPPEASGVADYTRRTVQALGKISDVDIYSNAESPAPTPEVKNFFPISEIPYTSGQYDNVLSVVGNSHFHIPIINLQRVHGGPCLIHDNRLAELYNWWKGEDYLAEMASKHLGRKVKASEVRHWMSHPGDLPSMFFCELIESATPLIVHSRGIQAQCFKEHGIKPEYLTFCCYRDFDVNDLTPSGKLAARAALGIGADDFVIISLGIVGPTKGPFQCIDSMSRLKKSGMNPHFFFVGSAGSLEPALRSHAAALNVAENIHFCGEWVSEQDYGRYVIAADMAVQLRNHFFGGLSGAMLDCIGSGLSTVANDDLAHALESPDSVVRISDELNSLELLDAILGIYQSKTYLDRLKPSRAEYVRKHSFERYAVNLLEILGLPYDSDSQMNSIANPHRNLQVLELAKS